MRERRLVITVSIALVIAIIGLVVLNLDDTDANDAAIPVGDSYSVGHLLQSGAGGSGQGGEFWVAVQFRDFPGGTSADITPDPDGGFCATTISGPVHRDIGGLVVQVQLSASGCPDLAAHWRLKVTETVPNERKSAFSIGQAPRNTSCLELRESGAGATCRGENYFVDVRYKPR